MVAVVTIFSLLASGWWAPHPVGFQVVLASDGQILISDADVSSYNSTSRQFTLTADCLGRLKGMDLYHKPFYVSLDGRFLQNGSFWASLDSMPPPSGLSILDIVTLQNGHANYFWMEACYPSGYYPNCQDPSFFGDIKTHFEGLGKLVS
jgi:hypothetical protein